MPTGVYVRTEEYIVNISGKNNHFYGKKHTKETQKKMRENNKRAMLGKKMPKWFVEKMRKVRMGRNNPAWKGGSYTTYFGYILIYSPNHPFANRKYIQEHRLIIEKLIGRYLTKKEIIHHKGTKYPMGSYEDKGDNRLKNLQLCKDRNEHIKIHRLLKKEEL